MTLGESVRKYRELRGWTQSYLADMSGINRNTLLLIEQDKVDPRYSTVEILAGTLNVSVDEITGFSERSKNI